MALEACDFRTLENLCPGRVGAPGSPLYEAGRRVFSRAGRIRSPAAVLRPADRNQVAAIMAWANAAGIRLSIRSGGHSFDGFPVRDDGVLLDLRGLSAVRYAPSGYLHAMTGATVGDIARALDGTGRAMPIGECPTVGVGGLVLGGGFGQCTRHFGLTSDFLAEATVVTASGQIHVTNAVTNANLFWGLRGGAGCVGIVTDLVFHTVPIQQVTGVTLGWRWDAAVEAILLFTQLMHTAPSELDLQLSIRTTGADRYADEASAGPADVIPGTPRVRIDGQFLGNQDDARSLMRPLLEHPAALHASIREESFFDAVFVSNDILHDPAPATLRPHRIASDIGRGALGAVEAAAIVGQINELQFAPELPGGAVSIEAINGAVAAFTPQETAFFHRGQDFVYHWALGDRLPADAGLAARHDALLQEIRHDLAGVLTGGRYVNYADILDTPNDWWGDNTDQLMSVVQEHDPDRILISRLNP
ncbi:FAD-binding oxidoreductase [Mycobacterium marinum]|uniref:FAD-binding oxidoreductase n=1 Tax=Mycobacterium marinum TaxID=1781 RepID=UPI00235A439F|nr:FAD-binding protein [Mycobacterium marinum]MDC9004218.1 FAD-binding protein [Mycobacterium marinum]